MGESVMYEKIKPILLKIDPETAHHLAEIVLSTARRCPLFFNWMSEKYFVENEKLHQKIWNLDFKHPVGTAGGFDKNAKMIQALPSLGFAWGEVGAITPKPQTGNEKPRVWRHIEEESLQNAFGFNNDGVEVISQRLEKIYPFILPICVNIGKNKTTPEDKAIEDYKILVEKLKDKVDFFTVNVSSPNTPNLRDLLNEEFISTLFKELKEITKKPILMKLSPDMDIDFAVNIAKIAVENGADGIIATNTTVDYSLIKNPQNRGGISGKVLKEKSYNMFVALAKELFGKTILISVGGIDSAEEAYKRIKAGASLIQVFTAFIYHGPQLIKNINNDILEFMKKDGYNHISEAIGADLDKIEINFEEKRHKTSKKENKLKTKINKRKKFKQKLYN
jgi:dihydroorotate dehydrogenase